MSTQAETAVTTQVYRVYIKASPQAIWEAITKPEWTQKYGYRGIVEYDGLRPGGTYRFLAPAEMQAMGMPEVVVDGEVIEADPPRKLVQTWRALWSEDIAAEGPTRVTYDIEEDDGGVTRLTVTHELEGAPIHAAQVASEARIHEGGGGWSLILSDLKTLLETGKSLES
jgi:uncharacterized protein YndB with AHSA1/START domain